MSQHPVLFATLRRCLSDLATRFTDPASPQFDAAVIWPSRLSPRDLLKALYRLAVGHPEVTDEAFGVIVGLDPNTEDGGEDFRALSAEPAWTWLA